MHNISTWSISDSEGRNETSIEFGFDSQSTVTSSRQRQPLVLLSLKHFAPPKGQLVLNGSHRVPKKDRPYDVLVEPGGAFRVRPHHTARAALVRREDCHVSSKKSADSFLPPSGLALLAAKDKVSTPMSLAGMSTRPGTRDTFPSRPCTSRVTTEGPSLQDWCTEAFEPQTRQERPATSRVVSKVAKPNLPLLGQERPDRRQESYSWSQGSSLQFETSTQPQLVLSRGSLESELTEVESLLRTENRKGNRSARSERQKANSKRNGSMPPLSIGSFAPGRSYSTRSQAGGSGSPFSSRSSTRKGLNFTMQEDTFQMDHNRMVYRPNVVLHKIRVQIKEMGQNLVQSMLKSYPREVWDACEISHPDAELEKARTMMEVAKVKAAEAAAEKVRGLLPALSKSSSSTSTAQEVASNGTGAEALKGQVGGYEETAASLREFQEEKALAFLARQTGWCILDVEDVRDKFKQYSVNGTINAPGPTFSALALDINPTSTPEEVQLLFQQITGVRRRSVGYRQIIRQNRGSNPGEGDHEHRVEIRFSEFFTAVVKWLPILEAKQRTKEFKENCQRILATGPRDSRVSFSLGREPIVPTIARRSGMGSELLTRASTWKAEGSEDDVLEEDEDEEDGSGSETDTESLGDTGSSSRLSAGDLTNEQGESRGHHPGSVQLDEVLQDVPGELVLPATDGQRRASNAKSPEGLSQSRRSSGISQSRRASGISKALTSSSPTPKRRMSALKAMTESGAAELLEFGRLLDDDEESAAAPVPTDAGNKVAIFL